LVASKPFASKSFASMRLSLLERNILLIFPWYRVAIARGYRAIGDRPIDLIPPIDLRSLLFLRLLGRLGGARRCGCGRRRCCRCCWGRRRFRGWRCCGRCSCGWCPSGWCPCGRCSRDRLRAGIRRALSQRDACRQGQQCNQGRRNTKFFHAKLQCCPTAMR
jgi:hypothetical protein